MSSWPAYTSYQADTLKAPLPPEPFRAEASDRPRLGDLIKPGMLVRTSYNTGPYLIDEITLWKGKYGETWSLTGLHATNGIADGGEHSRGWLNEYLAVWFGEAVRFLHLFPNNSDELFVVGSGFRADRRGQMVMF